MIKSQLFETRINGTLPTELAKLKGLYNMYLFVSIFSHSATIPHLLHISYEVSAAYTSFISGTIPTEFGNLAALQKVFVDRCSKN
jgi:hypothetical protein